MKNMRIGKACVQDGILLMFECVLERLEWDGLPSYSMLY